MIAEKTIIRILQEEIPDIVGIYVFGSQADRTARKDSDYDIAFLTDKPSHFDSVFLFDLAYKIGKVISHEIDLVNLHIVSLDLRFEVVAKGTRIFCGNTTTCDTFEMVAISMYQRFEEERRPLIEAYKKRIAAWPIQ